MKIHVMETNVKAKSERISTLIVRCSGVGLWSEYVWKKG